MSEKVMVGVVTGVVMASIISVGNTVYIAKMLNTTPSLPDRVLALEIKLSAVMLTLGRMDATLNKFNLTLDRFGTEQAVRTTTIDRANRHMEDPAIHKRIE